MNLHVDLAELPRVHTFQSHKVKTCFSHCHSSRYDGIFGHCFFDRSPFLGLWASIKRYKYSNRLPTKMHVRKITGMEHLFAIHVLKINSAEIRMEGFSLTAERQIANSTDGNVLWGTYWFYKGH